MKKDKLTKEQKKIIKLENVINRLKLTLDERDDFRDKTNRELTLCDIGISKLKEVIEEKDNELNKISREKDALIKENSEIKIINNKLYIKASKLDAELHHLCESVRIMATKYSRESCENQIKMDFGLAPGGWQNNG